MKYPFPFLSAGLGFIFMLLQLGLGYGSEGIGGSREGAVLPELLLLLINEFGMVVCAIGAWISVKHILTAGNGRTTFVLLFIANVALAGLFAYLGYILAEQTGVIDMILGNAPMNESMSGAENGAWNAAAHSSLIYAVNIRVKSSETAAVTE